MEEYSLGKRTPLRFTIEIEMTENLDVKEIYDWRPPLTVSA